MRIEPLESRRLMTADPIHVGVVYLETDYLETDSGSDSQGDRFILSFTGGAPGTKLTELRIRTDKDSDGVGIGDPIFDTAPGGRGKNGSHPFLLSPGQSEQVAVEVTDGGQELILRPVDFQAGDQLMFTIDVDEVLRNFPNLDQFNKSLDVITSGQEFQDSILEAVFDAPNYYTANADALFVNDYGDPRASFGLNLPADESNDPNSRPNRSAAAVGTARQEPIPASISGFVYRDDNDSGTKDTGEIGLSGVRVRLEPIDTIAPQASLVTTTGADGSYQFNGIMPGRYRVIEIDQPAGLQDGTDAAGTIRGSVVGTAVNPGDEINGITLAGGDAGINYNFGELPLGSIGGFVYLAAPGADCDGDHEADGSTPVVGAEIQLVNSSGQVIKTTTTQSDGSYRFNDLPKGVYSVIEITPAGLIDGGAHAGEMRTLASNLLVAVGRAVDAGTISDIALPAGGRGEHYNFCEAAPGSISGVVYHDRNDDGVRSSGEEAIAEVLLSLIDSIGNEIATTRTDNQGRYHFADLAPDTYRVVETQPAGFIDGKDSVGLIAGDRVGALGGDKDSLVDVVLRQGLHGVEYNFGERQVASISGRVHVDLDEDCELDPNEVTLEGVLIELKDASGNTIATTRTGADGMYRFDNLVPGTYSVVEQQPAGYFDGGAKAGSEGGRVDSGDRISQINLTSGVNAENYDFCERPPAQISGSVYVDTDADCERDADELGLGGVLIELIDDAGNVVATTTTDADGRYTFTNLRAGEYTVRETQPDGFFHGGQVAGSHGGNDSAADLISAVAIGWGQTLTEYDFCELPPSEISGVVYVDRDEDCFQDPNEEGLSGVLIELIDATGNVVATTTTNADGQYSFTNLRAGEYTVRETQPVGYFHGGQVAGSHGGNDAATDLISAISIPWGQTLTDYNFCELPPSEISGVVYVDTDQDCVRDADEVGLGGVLIELFDEAGRLVASTTTGDDGSYEFTNLPSGNYTIRETQPAGYFQGGQKAGSGGGDDSLDDVISQIQIGVGQTLVNYDFCEVLPGSISGKVFSDVNTNRKFDDTELPISGVLIELVDTQGIVVATTRTDADGCYRFDGLPPGTYQVRETQPEGFFHGGQEVGTIGGRILAFDVIGEIVVRGGDAGEEYNFPELPPATISGFVFQDGDALVMNNAPDPLDLRQFRDGQLTDDDARLSSITLELRDFSGVPIDAAGNQLGGTGGVIRVTTDASGYYEFTGLRPNRVYSVYQSQPDGFIDSLDTAGSTGGLAVNLADLGVDGLAVLTQRLAPGADPNFDAIFDIVVAPAETSQHNNFSEIVIKDQPLIPPPENDPPPQIIAPLVPIQTFATPIRPVGLPQFEDVPPPVLANDEWEVSWHLSVINGGFPRGDGQDEEGLFTVAGFTINDGRLDFQRASARDADQDVLFGGLPDFLLQVDLSKGRWQFLPRKSELGSGDEETPTQIRLGHSDAVALTGDFNGDGVDEAVLFWSGQWFVDLNGNGLWDAGDLWVRMGTELDRPVVGDWDGDGKDDVGIFGRRWHNDAMRIRRDPGLPDPANQRRRRLQREDLVHHEPTEEERQQRVLLRGQDGELLADAVDHVFQYGEQVDTPLAGDWNGDGIDQIGVFRSGQWLLDEDGDGRWTRRDQPYTFGKPGDEPVVGDFDGDGIDEIGVVRGDLWIIDTDGDRRLTGNDRRIQVPRSNPDSQPIVGDFDGDKIDEPGYYDAG
ncbi:SdrD B-like domain-containing protein [Neorhodopirellula pilleata]|uniref:Serine-aspartate repeat-containing protein D n=1 Tax=Neorhodopirellula pilleata TaxID=2714738 RepID=A0A5C6AXU0_9BACT|nr:SdrD B-like domain-containing protein [Neorhodopirellula pilleata]TWU03882.1 Serine-aspartate repeat-containing protein D precursor [Neorhodopirellula pilleata]